MILKSFTKIIIILLARFDLAMMQKLSCEDVKLHFDSECEIKKELTKDIDENTNTIDCLIQPINTQEKVLVKLSRLKFTPEWHLTSMVINRLDNPSPNIRQRYKRLRNNNYLSEQLEYFSNGSLAHYLKNMDRKKTKKRF